MTLVIYEVAVSLHDHHVRETTSSVLVQAMVSLFVLMHIQLASNGHCSIISLLNTAGAVHYESHHMRKAW